MRTVMYLVRHGATTANLEQPAKLQGRGSDLPLSPEGIRQAERTSALLQSGSIDFCYSSPLARAMHTAEIIARPHGIATTPLEALTECDVGRWEGKSWEMIREREPETYDRFMADPAEFGYPGGESFGDVYRRAAPVLDALLQEHTGKAILVMGHHVVNRSYLAALLDVPPAHARRVQLDNCGVSVIVREKDKTRVQTLNAVLHLHESAANS